MNFFDFFNAFWMENERQPFSMSEKSFYMYLLFLANRQHMAMPIRCSMPIICCNLKTSKQNVMKIRDDLKKRGVLDFEKGDSNGAPAKYTLLPLQLPLSLTGQLSAQLPQYKNNEIATSIHSDDSCRVPIQELKDRLLYDSVWQADDVSLLARDGVTLNRKVLSEKLEAFFLSLKVNGTEGKTESDCRQHFVNWLRKNVKNKNYERNNSMLQRRGTEVASTSKSDYEGAF